MGGSGLNKPVGLAGVQQRTPGGVITHGDAVHVVPIVDVLGGDGGLVRRIVVCSRSTIRGEGPSRLKRNGLLCHGGAGEQ